MTTSANLEFTGERYVPDLTGQIRYEHLHRYAIAARLAAGRRVLDLACGEGYGAALLARSAAEVVGVDADEAAIRHARAFYFAPNLRFARGSCTDLPLGEGAVDVVASFETIEHLVEQERMLDEIRRVLAPGGALVISSPNKLVYSDIPGFANPFHVRELYFADFRELLVRRFAHVALYGQRVTALSVVHPLASAVSERPLWYSGSPGGIDAELPALPQPMYFIAVASDAPLDLTIESAFVDPADDLLEDIWAELNAMRRQTALSTYAVQAQALPDGAPVALPPAQPANSPASDELVARVMELEDETRQLRAQSESHERRAATECETAVRLQAALDVRAGELEDSRAEAAAAHEQARMLAGLVEEQRAALATAAEARRVASGEAERERYTLEAQLAIAQRDVAETAAREEVQAAQLEAAAARAALESARAAELTRQLADERAAHQAESVRQQAALAAAARRLDGLEQQRAALAGSIDELRALQDELARRAASESGALRDVLGSHSWRLTYPLRAAGSALRRRAGR